MGRNRSINSQTLQDKRQEKCEKIDLKLNSNAIFKSAEIGILPGCFTVRHKQFALNAIAKATLSCAKLTNIAIL